jgi:hypothetical protein
MRRCFGHLSSPSMGYCPLEKVHDNTEEIDHDFDFPLVVVQDNNTNI